jgi:hypothetical protein
MASPERAISITHEFVSKLSEPTDELWLEETSQEKETAD